MTKYSEVNYQEYIRSDDWKAVKIRYLKSKMPKDCFVCDEPWSNSFVFHHRTYKRLGHEKLMDLQPMCRRCHQALHKLQKKYSSRPLWFTSKRHVIRKYIGLPQKGKRELLRELERMRIKKLTAPQFSQERRKLLREQKRMKRKEARQKTPKD
jgi:hypothetical protein